MRRGLLAPVKAFWLSGGRLVKAFRRQRMALALVLAFVLFLLSIVFAFLSFAPVLSPFVYPLF